MDRTIPSHITGLYLFTVVNLLALFHVTMVHGEITVMDNVKNITIATYDDMPALFGSSLPVDGISGMLVYVTPHNACSAVERPPSHIPNPRAWIALIAREGCDFAQKILNAQKAGYSVGIVHNKYGDEGLVPMSPGQHGREVNIPSVFVAYSTGMDMADNFDYKKRNIVVNVDGEIPLPNYKIYLWPFAIVVGICFLLMLVFMLIKWCIDRRRRNRSRLSTKHLKKIPIKKFKKGDSYDVCAICLDDYEEGEKLRILPCNHSYHRKCIDPWLTKNKKTCPICKRRVIPGDENETDSDTDTESRTTSTERTPLLANQSPSSSRTSTFDQSGLPEAVRNDVSTLHRQNDEDSDSVSSLHGAVGQTLIQVEDRKQIAVTSSDNSVIGREQEDVAGAVGGHSKEEVVRPKESRRKPRKERKLQEKDENGAVGGSEATIVDECKTEKQKKVKKSKTKSSSSKTKLKKQKTKASSSSSETVTEKDTETLLPSECKSTLTGEDNPVLSTEDISPETQDTTQARSDNSRNSSPGGSSSHSQDDVNFNTETSRPKHNQIV